MHDDTRLRLSDLRSLAYHEYIIDVLRGKPELLTAALERVDELCARGTMSNYFGERWREVLAQGVEGVACAVLEDSDAGRSLRQTTPFCGIMDPRTRWRIHREVGGRLANNGS